MKRLIVTADDFGLTKSVNEGIVKAYKEGIVTSLNLMPTGDAFEDALRLIKDNGLKDVGAHLALTETKPVSEHGKIQSLVTKEDRFRKGYAPLLLGLFFKRISRDDIYTELKSQLDRLKDAGIKPVSLSAHEHIHILPSILDIFIGLAKEHSISYIRYVSRESITSPYSVRKIYRRLVVSCFDKKIKKVLKESVIKHADNFLGFLNSGNLREDVIINMIKSLEGGTTELVCHPGFLGPEVLDRYRFHINCEYELYGLTSPRVKRLIKDLGIILIKTSDA